MVTLLFVLSCMGLFGLVSYAEGDGTDDGRAWIEAPPLMEFITDGQGYVPGGAIPFGMRLDAFTARMRDVARLENAVEERYGDSTIITLGERVRFADIDGDFEAVYQFDQDDRLYVAAYILRRERGGGDSEDLNHVPLSQAVGAMLAYLGEARSQADILAEVWEARENVRNYSIRTDEGNGTFLRIGTTYMAPDVMIMVGLSSRVPNVDVTTNSLLDLIRGSAAESE